VDSHHYDYFYLPIMKCLHQSSVYNNCGADEGIGHATSVPEHTYWKCVICDKLLSNLTEYITQLTHSWYLNSNYVSQLKKC
jgi:hypothetical protein